MRRDELTQPEQKKGSSPQPKKKRFLECSDKTLEGSQLKEYIFAGPEKKETTCLEMMSSNGDAEEPRPMTLGKATT